MRQSSPNPQLPRFAAGRYFANLSEHVPDPDGAYEELIRTLHGTPKHTPPARGANPYRSGTAEPARAGVAREAEAASVSSSIRSSVSRDVQRALAAAREAGATALLARHARLPQLAHATPEGRADELTFILRTHEAYLQELVRATANAHLSAASLAHEIEDVMAIAEWPQSGYEHIVRLPRTLGWAAHRLIGAALLLRGRASAAVDLARESVLWGEEPRKLINTPELIGWPIIPGNSREAWNHTRSWPQLFPWLKDVLGEQEYWIGMNAHFITLNFAEFLERAAGGPSFDQIRQDRQHGPAVPLYFWDEPTNTARRAFRLVAEDAKPGLRERVGTAIYLSLGELWERWLAFQRGWLAIETGADTYSRAPHEGLLAAVLG